MFKRETKVLNKLGIHARPSSLIVQTAQKFKSKISIIKNEAIADAKSIMSVMMLSAEYGSIVTIKADGEDEKSAVETVAGLFLQKFGED